MVRFIVNEQGVRSPVGTRSRSLFTNKSPIPSIYGKILAIDGHAGTGKTTLAKRIAKKLGFTNVNTGAMYRGFAYFVIKQEININHPIALKKALKNFSYEVKLIEGQEHYFVSNVDVTKTIYGINVTLKSTDVAKPKAVRAKLVKWQRKSAIGKDCVFEGRDMGSVVFPGATLKIYLTATLKERARRRYREIKEKDPLSNITSAAIKKQIRARDRNDSTRENSPTVKAPDAVEIKTSKLTLDQVERRILDLFYQKVGTAPAG